MLFMTQFSSFSFPFLLFPCVNSWQQWLFIMTEAAFAESAEYALHDFAKDIKYQYYDYNFSHILFYI